MTTLQATSPTFRVLSPFSSLRRFSSESALLLMNYLVVLRRLRPPADRVHPSAPSPPQRLFVSVP